MNAAKSTSSRIRLSVAYMLAQLLERLECSSVPVGAEQYRSVVAHLVAELAEAPADAELSVLLDNFPAAAQVYENMNYRHAGLCRSPLETATRAELLAQQAIEQARRIVRAEPHDDEA